MLKVLRIILAVIVVSISGYGLLTNNFEVQPYMMFLLGIMMLVTGIDELQKGRKEYGWLSIIVFLFCIFVSFKGMISN
ncbi:DUF3953 domain-containing protein [Bacillus sp. DNRA2]|nr:YczI family protein [Bacillus sp. DNRA2]NMD71247.1 DUF3953 domain-containing protein [Bacillus sp. DNRA2]